MVHLVLDNHCGTFTSTGSSSLLIYGGIERGSIRFRHGLKCMSEGPTQHDATVACACVQHVMSQQADAEGQMEYQGFFTADVCSCARCKFVLPSRALHTKQMMQLRSRGTQLRASSLQIAQCTTVFLYPCKHLCDKLQSLSR